MFLKNNEKGRSMVEMLGVLAIIGVLSVAGIVGYTIAMRKYRANEISEAISMLAVAAKTAASDEITADHKSYTDFFGGSNPAGASTIEINTTDTDVINVTLDSEELCTAVKNNFGTSSTNAIYVNNVGCADAPYSLSIKVK